MPTLSALLGDFSLSRDVSAGYIAQLTNAVNLFSRHLGYVASVEDLQPDKVNRFLEWLAENGRKPETVRGRRRMLVTLWRWAADNDLCDLPQKLRSVRVPENVPTAFTIDDMQRLLWAANYLNNPLYWKSLLLAAYDTALRLGDLLSIERQDIWPDGSLSIVQRKTGRTHRVQLRPETMEAIESYLNGRKTGTIWPLLTQTRNGFYAVFRRLKRWAKMENGSMKWLRRASASYVEASHPGMGWRHLGHAAPGLAEKCYLDPKIVRPKPTLPPRLTG